MDLYKELRPQRFRDLVGGNQYARGQALAQTVIRDNPASFYLFSGPHGVGKTTMAKIFAKAINCLNPPMEVVVDAYGNQVQQRTGDPCLTCENCERIESDTSADSGFIEYSAANLSGVSDVREKVVSILGVSHGLRRRVILLDEFHQFSHAAQDALLIPLEKKEMRATIIGCTSEKSKVRKTLISRAQDITLPPVSEKELSVYLGTVVSPYKGYNLSSDQVNRIARQARGSVRELLSLTQRFIESNYDPALLPPNWGDLFASAFAQSTLHEPMQVLNRLEFSGLSMKEEMQLVGQDWMNQISGQTDRTSSVGELIARFGIDGALMVTQSLFHALMSISDTRLDAKTALCDWLVTVHMMSRRA